MSLLHRTTVLAASVLINVFGGVATATSPVSQILPFVQANCIDCHDGPSGEGGFDAASLISKIDFSDPATLSDPKTMERWIRVVDRVHDGEMPPADAGEVDADEVERFLSQSQSWLHQAQQQHFDQLGRVQSRRLTKLQLERTLQDLFAIDVPLARLMPQEQRVDGFTGLADHQSISHFQLETHLTVVDAALDAAFARIKDSSKSFRRDYTARDLARSNAKKRCRDPEMIDGKAVVWSAGLTFYGRITSTTVREDGWYRITFSASAMKKPEDHGVWCTVRSGFCNSGAPLMSWIGSFEATDQSTTHSFDAWIPAGNMIEIRPGDETLRRAKFRGGQVGAGEGEPQDVPGVALESMTIERIYPAGDIELAQQHLFGDMNVSVDTKTNEVKFSAEPTTKDLTRQLRQFATRAFRRPVSQSELEPYVQWMQETIDGGQSSMEGLRAAYRAILCSPRFLYFVEPAGSLDGFAIANRLSYLLTNSMPDRQLTQLAREGKLRDHETIIGQVDRLLQSDRGQTFVADFADQWLDMADIEFTEPDRKLYRDFDIVVQNAMLEETRHYLEHLLDIDGGADKLIDSDFTFLNSRLARYYEIEGVDGDQIRKVSLPADSVRGGLLSQGSVLKITANGTNTSPVLRGVWVSERILGTPIPPPPESVPAVEPDIRGARTIREQLQKHLSDGACNTCHRNIDPPGYALENFDAAGQWRDKYLQVSKGKSNRGLPVDASFDLSDGRHFENFNQFRELIADDPRPIAKNFASQLLTYGTGAPVNFADRDDVDQIVEQTKEEDYGLRSLLNAVVTSEPFLSK